MHPYLYVLMALCLALIGSPAMADDHLNGQVMSLDREKGTVVVRPSDSKKFTDDVTIRMERLPAELQPGARIRVHGRFQPGDRLRFDAERLKIRHADPSGVRARLRAVPGQDDDERHSINRITESIKIPHGQRR